MDQALIPISTIQKFSAQVVHCTKISSKFYVHIQVVQEYERAVIFRLGRLLSGGSKGPGK